jgi:hypothetical protein
MVSVNREPRTSKKPPIEAKWRKKVHPFLIRLMEYSKHVEELGKSPSREDQGKAQQLARNLPEDLREQARAAADDLGEAGVVALHDFAGKILDRDLEDPFASKEPPDEQFMLSWLSWYKFGKTWKQLLHERGTGSRKASKQMLAVLADFEKWKFGEMDPNDLRFKVDRHHFNLMAFGMDFGIDKLTASELADYFDDLCPCGMALHDVENLKKLRVRIRKCLEKLAAKPSTLKVERKQ